MIRPQPESDISQNVMVLGADIIEILNDFHRDKMIVEDLLERFLSQNRETTPQMFFDTLIFLYSLGIIEESGYQISLVERAENDNKETSLTDWTD